MNSMFASSWLHLFLLVSSCGLPAVCQEEVYLKRIIGLNYPRLASLAHVQGKVELLVRIGTDGTVVGVSVVSGHDLLAAPAREALSHWSFSPSKERSGVRQMRLAVLFVLEGECDVARCVTDFVVDLPATVTVRSKASKAIID